MLEKLNQKDKRALRLGAIGVIAVIAAILLLNWIDHWAQVRKSLVQAKKDLKTVASINAAQEPFLSIVPVCQLPQGEEKQKILFRDKVSEQFKKAGVMVNPIAIIPTGSKRQAGYKVLSLKCSGKGGFDKALDFLSRLKENPYLISIEEFKIKCDPKKRQEFDIDMTVSTFTK